MAIQVSQSSKEPNSVYIDSNKSDYKISLSKTLTWYNIEQDKKTAYKYLLAYCKANKIAGFEKVKDSSIMPTWGWVARVVTNGAKLAENDINRLHQYISKSIEEAKKNVEPSAETPVQVKKPTVQDMLQEKIKEYLGEVEGEFDKLFESGFKTDFSLYNSLKANQLAPQYAQAVKDIVAKRLEEMLDDDDDSQIFEAYSFMGKRDKNAYIKFLNQCIEDADRYSSFKKANRKVRARKPKSPVQQVQRLKFKQEDTELNFKSIHPTEVVGAQQVWVLNTKTRKLQVYNATGATGIQVKGSSLQNFDPDVSIQKTVRKPADALKTVKEAGKVQLRRIMDNIKAKESPCNGRLNAECLIVRALK